MGETRQRRQGSHRAHGPKARLFDSVGDDVMVAASGGDSRPALSVSSSSLHKDYHSLSGSRGQAPNH